MNYKTKTVRDSLRTTVSTGAQPYQISPAITGNLTRVGTAGATNPMWAIGNEPTCQGDRRFSEGSPTLEDIPSRRDRRFSEGPNRWISVI